MAVVALLVRGTTCDAEDSSDRSVVSSPDRQFAVVFSDRQTFLIRDAHDAPVLSSRDFPHLSDFAEFRPKHVLWSPDGQTVAIAGGGGHDLETFILVHHGSTFVPVAVPRLTEGFDNPYVLPVKWIKGRRLVLDISGPYAGKSTGYHYNGRATVRIVGIPPVCEVLYKRITEHDSPDGT